MRSSNVSSNILKFISYSVRLELVMSDRKTRFAWLPVSLLSRDRLPAFVSFSKIPEKNVYFSISA